MAKFEKRNQIFKGNQFEFRRFVETNRQTENQITIVETYSNDNHQVYKIVDYTIIDEPEKS